MNDNVNTLKLPENYKFRTVIIKPWAKVFKVPMHIVRIDINDHGKYGTHGWQVRYRKQTKFFSDAKKSVRKSLDESLEEATKYLLSVYKGRKPQIKTEAPSRKNNEIQEVGIRLTRRNKKTRKTEEIYIEVSAIEKGRSAKKFYVGTANTITDERFNAKLEEAKSFRRKIVKEHEIRCRLV